MSILIFANGDMTYEPGWLVEQLAQASLVIAADGGVRHLLAIGRWPDVVIGDLDSWPVTIPLDVGEGDFVVHAYPMDKAETDLELAVTFAISQSALAELPIRIFGALGGRLDQSLGNIMLLALPSLRGKDIRLIDLHQQAWMVTSFCEISGLPGDKVSLIPLGGDVRVLQTSGLRWPLQDEWLRFGPSRGISNELLDSKASVTLASGLLICVHTSGQWQR